MEMTFYIEYGVCGELMQTIICSSWEDAEKIAYAIYKGWKSETNEMGILILFDENHNEKILIDRM